MSRTAKNAVIIMVATLLSRVLGFLRETILANFYGTSMVADVFVLTLNIPGLIIYCRFCNLHDVHTDVLRHKRASRRRGIA